MAKKKVSFTLTDDCMTLLKKIAAIKGISMAASLELMVRETAKKEKIN